GPGSGFSLSISGFSVSMEDKGIDGMGLEGKHLVVSCDISFNNTTRSSLALVDCGATGYSFVDKDFVRQHQIPTFPLKSPRELEVIDGRPAIDGAITELAKVTLNVGGHQENV